MCLLSEWCKGNINSQWAQCSLEMFVHRFSWTVFLWTLKCCLGCNLIPQFSQYVHSYEYKPPVCWISWWSSRMCLHMLFIVLALLSQYSHCSPNPEWTVDLCFFRKLPSFILCSHMSQANLTSPCLDETYWLRLYSSVALYPHPSNTKLFSPPWTVVVWVQKETLDLYFAPQLSHLNLSSCLSRGPLIGLLGQKFSCMYGLVGFLLRRECSSYGF